MIYIQLYYKLKNKYVIANHINYNIDGLDEGMDYAKEFLSELVPVIYLKKENSNELLKIHLIKDQVVISYILDLFNIIKECKHE